MEVRRRNEQVGHRLVGQGLADHLVRLGPERQPVLRFRGARLALRVVERPLVERHDALPGRLDQLLAELDRLGKDDLLLGGEQRDLADLLEVHPDRVVDPDHVGRERLELLGRRLLELLRVELRRHVDDARDRALGAVADDLDVHLDRVAEHIGGDRQRVTIGRDDVVLVLAPRVLRHLARPPGSGAAMPASPPRGRPARGGGA